MSDTSDAHANTSGWLQISQAPKDGTRIIALLEGKRTDDDVMVVRWLDKDEDGEAGWWDDYGGMFDVKWWIPKPEKPKYDSDYNIIKDWFKSVSLPFSFDLGSYNYSDFLEIIKNIVFELQKEIEDKRDGENG